MSLLVLSLQSRLKQLEKEVMEYQDENRKLVVSKGSS
jgi:hypothetical protein